MPSVQRSISEAAPLSTILKPFLLHLSKIRPFNCCIEARLTLELHAMLQMKIIPMLLFLHLRPTSITSFQISLIDLILLSRLFKQILDLAFERGNTFKETSPFLIK